MFVTAVIKCRPYLLRPGASVSFKSWCVFPKCLKNQISVKPAAWLQGRRVGAIRVESSPYVYICYPLHGVSFLAVDFL